MTERKPCTFKGHDLEAYTLRDEPASVLVRTTCSCCDHFRILEWCSDCYNSVRNSGRRWRCAGCQETISPEEKLQHVIRIGSV